MSNLPQNKVTYNQTQHNCNIWQVWHSSDTALSHCTYQQTLQLALWHMLLNDFTDVCKWHPLVCNMSIMCNMSLCAAETEMSSFWYHTLSLLCQHLVPTWPTNLSQRFGCVMLEVANVASSPPAEMSVLQRSGKLTNVQSSAPSDADSTDITWGHSSDFTQLPLETVKAF